eukprot:jgi/Bigna1/88767/estExt_fgenesh1_pg.C_380004
MDTLRVKFTHYTKVRERSPYTVYEIAVQSPSTISWVIYKRYKDFDKLHNSLKKDVRLPPLPPKRLFQIMEATFVENRMAQLQEYMSKVLQLPNLMRNSILIDFLKVPDSVRPMLLSDNMLNTSSASNSTKASPSGARTRPTYPGKSIEEQKVFELVDSLRSSTNRVAAIADFEAFFFRARPRLSKTVTQYLFLGQSGDQKNSGGLIDCCGLLDVERNKDAHTFVEVFTCLKPAKLSRMNLHKHVDEERGSRLGAFRLLSVLREKMGTRAIEQILGDEAARSQYFRWAERKRGFVAPISNKPPMTLLKSIKLGDTPPKTVARDAFKSILEAAKSSGWMAVRPIFKLATGQSNQARNGASSMLNRRKGVDDHALERHSPSLGLSGAAGSSAAAEPPPPPQSAPPPSPPRHHQQLTSNPSMEIKGVTDGNVIDTEPTEGGGIPERLPGLASAFDAATAGAGGGGEMMTTMTTPRGTPRRVFKIEYKVNGEEHTYRYTQYQQLQIVMVRTQCLMDFSIEEITSLILDSTRREQWDLKFHRGQVVAQLGNNIDIVHYVFKSFSSPYKYRDFCLLRSWTELQNGGRLVAMRSVIHPRVPEQKDYSRAILYPTGYLIVPASTDTELEGKSSSSDKSRSDDADGQQRKQMVLAKR